MKKTLNLSHKKSGFDARINLKLRKVIRVTVISTITFSLLAIFFIIINKIFSLKEIEVVAEDIQIIVDQDLLNNNLLFIPAKKIEEQLLSEYTQLSYVKLKKKYPHTLVIVAEIRSPIAQIRSSNKSVLVDEEGIVIGEVSENNQRRDRKSGKKIRTSISPWKNGLFSIRGN